jgi:hypothetical protein
MTEQDLWGEFVSLPVDAQRQVTDFISFLRQKYQAKAPMRENDVSIQNDKFVGMWSDREDLADSTDWIRNLRDQEWSR